MLAKIPKGFMPQENLMSPPVSFFENGGGVGGYAGELRLGLRILR